MHVTSSRCYTVRTIAVGALAALAVLAGLTLADHRASAALPGLNGRLACEGERGTAAGGTAPGFPEHVTPRNEI